MCSTFCCLYSLKAENQFHLLISFLPAFVLYTSRGSRPVTFIHHLCTSSLTVFRLLPGITRLIFFNLLKKPYITTTLLSARPNMELAKSHCSAVSTDVQLKVIWKEQEREWEREHDKRKWRRKEKGPENDEKCSCHCRYLQFFSCMQHLQTLKVEPHYWKGFNWKDGSSCTFPTDFLWYKQPVLFPDNQLYN